MFKMCFCILIFPLWSLAYIPSTDMILSRLNSNKGSGRYRLSQKVSFSGLSKLSKPFQFYETWWKSPHSLYVRVTSPDYPKMEIHFSYRRSGKTWMEQKSKKVTKSGQYIEPFFSLDKHYPHWISVFQNVKLGRAVGVVNYVFQSQQKNPIMWIEQDEFVIRQLKTASDSFLTAGDYQNYSRGFLFPKKRKFISPEYNVDIELISVEPLKANPSKKLKENKWGDLVLSEDIEFIKKFYQDIR